MSSSETEHESDTPRGARLLRDQILGGNFDRDLVTNQRPGSSDHSGPIRGQCDPDLCSGNDPGCSADSAGAKMMKI